ncbi:MAG: winged helix-turn-helix transcriptional regulator [Paracoccaceae bacterium]
MIGRIVVSHIPPPVEYEITDLGMQVYPLFRDLCILAEPRPKS